MERFWGKVDRSGDCWLWTAGRFAGTGYGMFWLDGRTRLAHRVAYELAVGPIPAGKQLDHLCRVKACVRPEHLEPVSGSENTLRGDSPEASRQRAAERTTCRAGHPWVDLYIYPDGRRTCRICRAIAHRRSSKV